jgi:PAS domain S-box-containing protein
MTSGREAEEGLPHAVSPQQEPSPGPEAAEAGTVQIGGAVKQGEPLHTSARDLPQASRISKDDIGDDAGVRNGDEDSVAYERFLLRALIDNLPDLIYFKDTKGRYVLNNRAHLLSIGAARQEDVLGKTTFDFNPPELAKQYFEDEMQIVLTGKALLDREELALHRDTGEKRWHLTSKIPLKDHQGKVTGIAGISRDITERKNLEKQRDQYVLELKAALERVKTLSGLLPICASCKNIRDDQGYWQQVEGYIMQHSQAKFTHSLCPECVKRLYPEVAGSQTDDESPAGCP